jgi:hypothetical protein
MRSVEVGLTGGNSFVCVPHAALHVTARKLLHLRQGGPKKVFDEWEWRRILSSAPSSQGRMKDLVLDFLITEVRGGAAVFIPAPPGSGRQGVWSMFPLKPALAPQGYLEAAEAFSRESGTTSTKQGESVVARSNIRGAIQAGNIQQAVELLNDLHPQVWTGFCAPVLVQNA